MGKKHNNQQPIDVDSEKEETTKIEPAFKDTSLRFAVDDLIRKHDYIIWKREKGKEPVWIKNGEVYTESEILHFIDPDKLDDAKYAQDLYNLGYR